MYSFWLSANVSRSADGTPDFDPFSFAERLASLWKVHQRNVFLSIRSSAASSNVSSSRRRLGSTVRWIANDDAVINVSTAVVASSPEAQRAIEASTRLFNVSVLAMSHVVRLVGLVDCAEDGGDMAHIPESTQHGPDQSDPAAAATGALISLPGWLLFCALLIFCRLRRGQRCQRDRGGKHEQTAVEVTTDHRGGFESIEHRWVCRDVAGVGAVVPGEASRPLAKPPLPTCDGAMAVADAPDASLSSRPRIAHDDRLPPQWELEWRRRELEELLNEKEAQLAGAISVARSLERQYLKRQAEILRQRDEAREELEVAKQHLSKFSDQAIRAISDSRRETAHAQADAADWHRAHEQAQQELATSRERLASMTAKLVDVLERGTAGVPTQPGPSAHTHESVAETKPGRFDASTQTRATSTSKADAGTQKADIVSIRPLKLLKPLAQEAEKRAAAATTIQKSFQTKQVAVKQDTAARTIQRSVQTKKATAEAVSARHKLVALAPAPALSPLERGAPSTVAARADAPVATKGPAPSSEAPVPAMASGPEAASPSVSDSQPATSATCPPSVQEDISKAPRPTHQRGAELRAEKPRRDAKRDARMRAAGASSDVPAGRSCRAAKSTEDEASNEDAERAAALVEAVAEARWDTSHLKALDRLAASSTPAPLHAEVHKAATCSASMPVMANSAGQGRKARVALDDADTQERSALPAAFGGREAKIRGSKIKGSPKSKGDAPSPKKSAAVKLPSIRTSPRVGPPSTPLPSGG